MLALIVAAGLIAGSILTPNSQQPTASSYPQVSACPPCVDQLPPGARVIETASGGPDASGATETLVAYFVRDPSFGSFELGHLGAIAVRTSFHEQECWVRRWPQRGRERRGSAASAVSFSVISRF